MTSTEALDVARIDSVAGMLPGDVPLIRHRPFRTPYHLARQAGGRRPLTAVICTGKSIRDGSTSLALNTRPCC